MLILALFLFFIGTEIILSILRGIIPPLPSSPPVVTKIISIIKSENVGPGVIADIGSGYGYLLFRLAKNFPERQCVGYEISLLAFLTSYAIKLIFRFHNVTVRYGNAFELIEKENTKIACAISYLHSAKALNEKMERVFANNITGMLIANTYSLENRTAYYTSDRLDIFGSKVFVYRK